MEIGAAREAEGLYLPPITVLSGLPGHPSRTRIQFSVGTGTGTRLPRGHHQPGSWRCPCWRGVGEVKFKTGAQSRCNNWNLSHDWTGSGGSGRVGPGRGGGSYCVPRCVPVTRAVTAQGPVWISGLMAHGGVQCQDWGPAPFLGWSKGFSGSWKPGHRGQASLDPPASLQPGSCSGACWAHLLSGGGWGPLALVGIQTCPALKCPVLGP